MKKISFALLLYCCASLCTAQNVGIGTPTPNASAMLDISSNNKGLIIPRMISAQRNAIVAPAKGLMVFDSSQNSFWYYTGASWKEIAGNTYSSDSALLIGQQTGSIASYNLIGNTISNDSSGYLYDSGGPAGNYGNNETFQHTIFYNTADQLAIDLTVLSNNLESPYDSLIIFDNSGHRYVLLGTSTGTYRFFSQITIQFKSNFANTLAGFAIRWNGVFLGNENNYDPNQTAGWYYNPSKNYMRGGVNVNNNWSPDSSGMYSFAFGNNNKAKGNSSIAMGYSTTASDSYSTAMGYSTTASGISSTAIGYSTTASGIYSTAMGIFTTASGDYSTAMGNSTKASGGYSTAIGKTTTASGSYSTVMGAGTTASGYGSTAMGLNTSASGDMSTAIGYYTKSKSFGGLSIGLFNDSTNAANTGFFNPFNRIFEIGNGTANNARSNAMTVLYNGNIGIGTTTPAALLQAKNGAVLFDGSTGATPVSGSGARMMWIPAKAAFRVGIVSGTQWDDANIGSYSYSIGSSTIASGSYSIAIGNTSTASGFSSTALGGLTSASGSNSTAMGYLTNASGTYSTAIGYQSTATGAFSTSFGFNSSASGTYSIAMGYHTQAKSLVGFSIGIYNDSTNAANATGVNPLNRIFEIGNGTANNARSNAMTVLQNGKVGIGLTSPVTLLDVNGDASFNDKTILLRNGADLNHGLKYDAGVNGPYLFGYDGGALGAVGFSNSLTWNKNGNVSVLNNFTVQNGKGIIRSTDGTQKKQLSTNVLVNTSLAAGASTSINFTFSESFSSAPDAYVGNVVSGGGGWAEVIMTIGNVSTTGGTLYVHNSTNGIWNPNFTVKVIAIGPQ